MTATLFATIAFTVAIVVVPQLIAAYLSGPSIADAHEEEYDYR